MIYDAMIYHIYINITHQVDLRTITLGVPPQEVKIMNKDSLSTLNNDNKQERIQTYKK